MTLARGKPGISLKLSALVTLLIVAELILLNILLDRLGPEYRTATLLVFVVGTGVVGFLFALALDILVTRPLVRLAQQVRRLSEAGYQDIIAVSGIDEPRELGMALEQMRQTVVTQQAELMNLNQELEARVEARTEELRRAQAQLVQAEKLASVGELAGGVAHEVNNPTSVILARTSHLLSIADEEGFDPDLIDDLEVLVHQAGRIKAVTDNLLSFARRSNTPAAPVDLVEVCALASNLLKHMARKASVTIALDMPPHATIIGNRDGLEQVIFNLLKNAIQALPEGGRAVLRLQRPAQHHRSDDLEMIYLTVDDDGPGVAPELRHKIFDPFFTTKPVGQGTGLGLSVVYGIVSEHRGTITVEESPEGGARFRVALPVAAAAASLSPPESAGQTP